MEHELRNFRDTSLAYVSKLHEVNEKKKFEFVEIVSGLDDKIMVLKPVLFVLSLWLHVVNHSCVYLDARIRIWTSHIFS